MSSPWLIWLILAYLAGSIPFGLIIGLVKGVDIRKQGSGNIGATNAGRVLGAKWGVICFVLDVLKGTAPVLAYKLVVINAGDHHDNVMITLQWMSIAAATMLGHIYPVWLKFKGGKGVATGLGALLGLWPVMTLAGAGAFAIWLAVVLATGYVSLGSMIAAGSLPVLVTVIALTTSQLVAAEIGIYVTLTLLLAAMVVIRHKTNIARLRNGTESRISKRLFP